MSDLLTPPTLEVYWLLGWLLVGYAAGILSAYLTGFFGDLVKDLFSKEA